MPSLPSDLRRVLENAVVTARAEATTAAGAALKRLAVAAKDFPSYLTPDERLLRLKLRAAARQLGDPWNADKQVFASLSKIAHEVAYEHWHRMLFARFLAENNLLMHPEHGVNVDLATIAELAQEEAVKTGVKADTWAMAGHFAAGMLPLIFRPDDPALAVQLAPEHQQALEKILESLPPSVFTADDSLGWVYQFWQSAEKERVNNGVKAGDKITGETLPAVTQLFTEHYMVLFLLHNTVGAWWAGKQIAKLRNGQMAEWKSEADARAAVALPGYSFDYLRFVKDEATNTWRPAAGTFDGWPNIVKELKLLDPCCGSGHFLVAALELLLHLRMAEEGSSRQQAAAAVIAGNLFGLELDPRCTQIAAFNVALAAWKQVGEHFLIDGFHIACSGVGPSASLEQWLKLADKNSRAWIGIPHHARSAVINGLTHLHHLFTQAPELGSLINPSQLGSAGALFTADWETLQPFLAAALTSEKDEDAHEQAVAAQGMAKAAEILSGEYTLVITNVPYKGRSELSPSIAKFMKDTFSEAKSDLATVFISRAMYWIGNGKTFAFVSPQSWFTQWSYRDFRRSFLAASSFCCTAVLGEEAWQSFGARGPKATLTAVVKGAPSQDSSFWAVDVAGYATIPEKINALVTSLGNAVKQHDQLDSPDHRLTLAAHSKTALLSEYAASLQGISTTDNPRFVSQFWEVTDFLEWSAFQGATSATIPFGGKEAVLRLGMLQEEADENGAAIRGRGAWGHEYVAIRQLRDLFCTMSSGLCFDTSVAALVPKDAHELPAIWAYCESPAFTKNVRELERKNNVTNGTFAKIPFDLAHWQAVAAEKYPNGLPEPESDDPTQWLFHGRPVGSDNPLQVAVARLLGYRWPAELDASIRLSTRARELVASCDELLKFADKDGVVPLVPLNKEPPGVERARSLLEIAYGEKWTPGLLNDLLAAAGSPGKSLHEWLKNDFFAQHCSLFHQRPFVWQIWDGKKDGFNILVNYHCLAEGDGKGKKLLEKIVYVYLGDWITQQQATAKQGVAGADLRLKAAQDLQKKLEAIIAGEPPFDIFVRWKPLHEQPIGWNPDINDGVRLNIRPFVNAGVLRGKVNVKWTKDRGKEPESIRPKAKFPWFWSCPEDEPPTDFAGGVKFTGERLNDLHYTSKAKQAASAARSN